MSSVSSISRTIVLTTPPRNGDSSVGVVCSTNRISYSRTEAYQTTVYLTVNEGGNAVTPTAFNLQLAYESSPNTFTDMVIGQQYSYMTLVSKNLGAAPQFVLSFLKGADFKGTIKVTLRYKDTDYVKTIDVGYFTETATLESQLKALVYNPADEDKSVNFEAYLTIDGVRYDNVNYHAYWINSDDSVVQADPVTFHKNIKFGKLNGKYFFAIKKGASFEGSLQLTLYEGDVSRTLLIPVIKAENGKDSISLVCSTYAFSYNPIRQNAAVINVQIKGGEQTFVPTIESAAFVQDTTTRYTIDITQNSAVKGMYTTFGEDEEKATIGLVFPTSATANGTLELTYTFSGRQYDTQISITRVQNGGKGDPGERGAIVRGPRLWTDVKTAHGAPNDTEKFYKGTDGEPFADIVLVVRDANNQPCKRFFAPKNTHLVHSSPHPIYGTNAAEYWEQFSDVRLISTDLLLADKAKINNLFVDDVEILDDNNEPIFEAYKDTQGEGVVHATMGLFEGVDVKGDIKVNTMTYYDPLDNNGYPLSSNVRNGEMGENRCQFVKPTGGCILAAKGRCDLAVVLPKIEKEYENEDYEIGGSDRQIIIINQKLSSKQSLVRRIYLICGDDDVWICPDIEKSVGDTDDCTVRSKNSVLYLGGFGIYYLFAYRTTIYNSLEPQEANRTRNITVWALWRADKTLDKAILNQFPDDYSVPDINVWESKLQTINNFQYQLNRRNPT